MSQEKIKVGDRVESTKNGEVDGVAVQGVVKSIYVEMTRGGPAAVYKVSVDRKGGVEIDDAYEIDTPAHLWQSTAPAEPCVDCGDIHGPNFGPEVMDIFLEYQKAKDTERSFLLIELAQAFIENLKDSELMVPESMHDLVSKAKEAAFSLENLQARIGRCVVTQILDFTKLKTLKDVIGGLGGQVLNVQDIQNILGGKAPASGSSNPLDLLDFDKKKKAGGHGSVN
jgi:hypothetical protein